MSPDAPRLWFQIRIGEGRFGPGKADLLTHIRESGSLSEAARRMNMSYRRAWTLLEAINALAGAPAVETERGGARGGGSRLTARGEALLAAYETLRATLTAAAVPTLASLAAPEDADG
jgi:molybdate transport system regulatory protein